MTFSLARLHRSRSYWTVLLLFAIANVLSWVLPGEMRTHAGFPFPFFIAEPDGGALQVTGLLLDIVLAWTLAVAAAWIGFVIRESRQD